MTRAELERAGERLESAAEAAGDDDAADRLRNLAGQLETLSTRDRGPDHGRLARIEIAMDELVETVEADVAAEIDAAHDDVVSFRETIEGV